MSVFFVMYEATLILLGWYRYAVAKSESKEGIASYPNALCHPGGFELIVSGVAFEGDCPETVTGFPGSEQGTGPCVETFELQDSLVFPS